MRAAQERAMRWGLGPVFIYECVTSSRRWQTYLARSLGVSVLLVTMTTIAWANNAILAGNSAQEYARLGEAYFYGLIGVELALVMLVAPAAAAGAICLDRSTGTLAHMLATDLSDAEIVLGKLAARLLPVMGLVACTWPVLAISSLLGGIDPLVLTMAFAVIVAVAVLGCVMALALSVWARSPHEVALVCYAFWIFVLLLWPIWFVMSSVRLIAAPSRWFLLVDPFYLAFAPYLTPGRVKVWDYVWFFAATLGASVALAALAIWRMRPVASGWSGERTRGTGLGRLGRLIRWLPVPSLDGNPVLWREWHRSRPSPWMMRLLVLVGGTTGLVCVGCAFRVWQNGINLGVTTPSVVVGLLACALFISFGLLMLAAVAPLSMSEERQRGSLDILAATPLSTRTIVLGKWLGTFRLAALAAIVPGLMALAFATTKVTPRTLRPGLAREYAQWYPGFSERLFGAALFVAMVLAHGALNTSLGLALAIWLKRQSRAIALNLGLFVLTALGWPVLIFAAIGRSGYSLGLSAISPIFCAIFFSELVVMRDPSREFLWWVLFWVVMVTFWAMGLLWLTVRTFDRSCGRMPERPRPTRLLPDLVLLWAGTTAIICAAGAFVIWREGIGTSFILGPTESSRLFGNTIIVNLDLFILSIVAPASMSEERRRPGVNVPDAASRSARSVVFGKWWGTFRLVVLLAIGPVLWVLAVATAFEVARPGMPIANLPVQMKLTPGIRLYQFAVLVVTLLAHGAAITSAGLVLGRRYKRRGYAIGVSFFLFVLIALAWPLFIILIRPFQGSEGLTALSPVSVVAHILENLMTRTNQFPDVVWWGAFYDVVVILLAALLLAVAVRTIDRNSELESPDFSRRKGHLETGQPARETVFAGD
jgi:ABC-type transport system involved in multi-copper enzyme maturation permease subunit